MWTRVDGGGKKVEWKKKGGTRVGRWRGRGLCLQLFGQFVLHRVVLLAHGGHLIGQIISLPLQLRQASHLLRLAAFQTPDAFRLSLLRLPARPSHLLQRIHRLLSGCVRIRRSALRFTRLRIEVVTCLEELGTHIQGNWQCWWISGKLRKVASLNYSTNIVV